MARKTAPYLAFAIIVIAMVWIRVWVGASGEYDKGQNALQSGDPWQAIHHFDRSIHWYSPMSSPVARSVDALVDIAEKSATAGETDRELYAWRILRSALYSTRNVVQPYKAVIAKADENIARLMAQKDVESGKGDFNSTNEKRLAQLTRKVGPNTGFALLSQLGFFGWVICGFLFIWFGIKPDKGFHKKLAIIFAALFVVFYVLWIIGLHKA